MNVLRRLSGATLLACAFMFVFAGEAMADGSLSLSSGLVLSVPSNWKGSAMNSDTASLVGPDGQSTIIATNKPGTPEEVRAQLSAPIDLGRGVVLTPTTAVHVLNGLTTADFNVSGAQGPAKGIVVFKALGGGRYLGLIAIVPPGSVEGTRPVLNAIMASSTVRAPPASVASSSPNSWASYMRGRYIARFYSGNGYSEKHEMWFCSDGTFATAMDGGGFTSGVASGAFGSNGTGTWTATGETSAPGRLLLVRDNGQQGELQLQLGSDGIYLGRERWLRGDNNRCQ